MPDVGPFFVEILEDEPFRLVLQVMQECHMSACHLCAPKCDTYIQKQKRLRVLSACGCGSMGVGLCARGACVRACVRGMQAYKHTEMHGGIEYIRRGKRNRK